MEEQPHRTCNVYPETDTGGRNHKEDATVLMVDVCRFAARPCRILLW